MIRYTLKCPEAHQFDSWFGDAEGFEKLRAAGQLACPQCGSKQVEKALMAPSIRAARKSAFADAPEAAPPPAEGPPTPAAGRGALSAPQSPLEAALSALRREVEANSDYVGKAFAAEARAMHQGEAPARAIHGEAKIEEARQLLEEGVPLLPLPFLAAGKSN